MLRKKNFSLIAVIGIATASVLAQTNNRVRFNDQDLFLNGGNVAWVDFARDIGPGQTNMGAFRDMYRVVSENGGTAMRLWLHTTGVNTPEWSTSGTTSIIGPGVGAIEDLRTILDDAWDNNIGLILCLWSFDMLNTRDNPASVTDRAYELLTDDFVLQSYIDSALVPIVKALGDHPAIISWEIFNEAEGMSEEYGWDFNRHVPMSDIQKFVNRTAGAIHRTNANAKVSTGAWSFHVLWDGTGAANDKNYYSDEELRAAGEDELGTLDFYMVHYYPWAHTSLSPFHHDADYWNLDKPIVVGEFGIQEYENNGTTYTNNTYGVPFEDHYQTLYDRGYAGALVWQWWDWYVNRTDGHAESWENAVPQMKEMSQKYSSEIRIVKAKEGMSITEFSTDKTEIDAGGEITLTWHVQNAVWVELQGEAVDSAGQKTFTPNEDTKYVLSAKGKAGEVDSATIFIKVNEKDIEGYFTRFEAEDGITTGEVIVTNNNEASSGQYLDLKSDWTLTFEEFRLWEPGEYRIVIGYQLPYDSPKSQYLILNGDTLVTIEFTASDNTSWNKYVTSIYFERDHNNQIAIHGSWNWMAIDYIDVEGVNVGLPIGETSFLPSKILLEQNYPNPFNPGTSIRYSIPNAGEVRLSVFSITGQEITTLVNAKRSAGTYSVSWDASKVSSGIYICRLSMGEDIQTRKMVLIK